MLIAIVDSRHKERKYDRVGEKSRAAMLIEYLSGKTCAIIRGDGYRSANILAAVPAVLGSECRGLGDHDAYYSGHLARCVRRTGAGINANPRCAGQD